MSAALSASSCCFVAFGHIGLKQFHCSGSVRINFSIAVAVSCVAARSAAGDPFPALIGAPYKIRKCPGRSRRTKNGMIGALPRALNTAGPLGSVVHRPKSWHGIPSGLYPQSLSRTMKPPRFSALNTSRMAFQSMTLIPYAARRRRRSSYISGKALSSATTFTSYARSPSDAAPSSLLPA